MTAKDIVEDEDPYKVGQYFVCVKQFSRLYPWVGDLFRVESVELLWGHYGLWARSMRNGEQYYFTANKFDTANRFDQHFRPATRQDILNFGKKALSDR